jgi:DNA ligase D-like protein (predicted ligase)
MNTILLPMLATRAAPFDSDDYLFEVKWDGVRALAEVEDRRWRLWGRHGSDYTERYPELAVLRRFPTGTIIDGELIVLQNGRADFPALLRRHQRSCSSALGAVDQRMPVHYVVFDLLFGKGRSLLRRPLRERREGLRELLGRAGDHLLSYSDGVVGSGCDFFAQVVAGGHEGVMAKHLASTYRAGVRSPVWKKIKPRQILPCVIVGYRLGRNSVRSVLVAAMPDGGLQYVAEVSRGFTTPARAELARRLRARPRSHPIVPCPTRACWVEPELYCRIRFQEWTRHGRLRHPAFDGWLAPRGRNLYPDGHADETSDNGSESA